MSRKAPSRRTGRVRRLPDALVDQIAAGEVVERPASVVKELVENALDAGARRVRVEVRGGGCDLLCVTDDGHGMTPVDAESALERHATSKLTEAADLETIATYGFRGEALPAIASVSTLRLRTRHASAEEAFEIRVAAGKIAERRHIGGPLGTRIEVVDLFANVPARRKFLKTATTEWGHIADWVSRSALALPEVHFEVRRDDRAVIAWPAVSDPLDRIAAVLGEEDAAAFVPVAAEEGRARITGFATHPERHRATLAGIHLFVNRRPVRDRVLQHALVSLYRDVLPRGRFPAAVLFVEVPFEAVDVNVHPAKWEVRFADPQGMHRLVRRAVEAALGERRWLGGPGTGSDAAGARAPVPLTPSPAADPSSPTDWVFAQRGAASAEPTQPGLAAAPATDRLRFADQRLLGQFLATYLVLEGKAGLLLVDQHAAHERVLYERLREEWLGRAVESQGLLAPVTVQLAPAQLGALEAGAHAVTRLGFEVDPFGEGCVAVRAVPALLSGRDPSGLVRDLADEIAAADGARGALSDDARALAAVDHILATLACHSARRKGDALDVREQQALLDALDAIPWAPTCPHGRPVAVPVDLAEIERRFARR